MVWGKLETWDELKAICFFHIVGFVMELFKTSAAIGSWKYPDFAYTKLWEVPLFTGFMYSAVGSYLIQAWRFLKVRIEHYPPYWMATLVALAIYINFFSHHFIGDYRWYLTAFILGLYARSVVYFTPYDTERKMPLLLAFVLIGFLFGLLRISVHFLVFGNIPTKLVLGLLYMQANGALGHYWSLLHLLLWFI